MRATIKAQMRKKIEDAIYAAWMEELLARGDDAIFAHRAATAAVQAGMYLLDQAWLTVDWLPAEPSYQPQEPDPRMNDPLLRRLMLQ